MHNLLGENEILKGPPGWTPAKHSPNLIILTIGTERIHLICCQGGSGDPNVLWKKTVGELGAGKTYQPIDSDTHKKLRVQK